MLLSLGLSYTALTIVRCDTSISRTDELDASIDVAARSKAECAPFSTYWLSFAFHLLHNLLHALQGVHRATEATLFATESHAQARHRQGNQNHICTLPTTVNKAWHNSLLRSSKQAPHAGINTWPLVGRGE